MDREWIQGRGELGEVGGCGGQNLLYGGGVYFQRSACDSALYKPISKRIYVREAMLNMGPGISKFENFS